MVHRILAEEEGESEGQSESAGGGERPYCEFIQGHLGACLKN